MLQLHSYTLHGNFSCTGNVVPAIDRNDYTGELEILNFNRSNARDPQCITVQTIEDILYEGEEIFGFVLSTDDSITIPKPRITVHLIDNDGK